MWAAQINIYMHSAQKELFYGKPKLVFLWDLQ